MSNVNRKMFQTNLIEFFHFLFKLLTNLGTYLKLSLFGPNIMISCTGLIDEVHLITTKVCVSSIMSLYSKKIMHFFSYKLNNCSGAKVSLSRGIWYVENVIDIFWVTILYQKDLEHWTLQFCKHVRNLYH